MSRIGIVSYYAPPYGAVASHRVLRISRVLLDAGHAVHWITLSQETLPYVDESLAGIIPPGIRRHELGPPCADSTPATTLWAKIRLNAGHAARDWLAVPDVFSGWLRRLRRALPGLVRREKLDTLYFCCGPHSPILTLPRLRRLFPSLQLLVDYRDLLSGNAWNDAAQTRRSRKVLASERSSLAVANGLFVNTSAAYDRFVEVVQPPPALRVAVMRNAADYELATQITHGANVPALGAGVHLGYFGNVFATRRLLPVLKAMAALPPEQRSIVRLHCYCGAPAAELIAEDTEQVGLTFGRDVIGHGPVPYAEALRAMRAMDALVLVNGPTTDDRIFVPGKLFDYLMARRPVIFLGEPGDASRIVSDCCGDEWCCRHSEEDRLVALLASLSDGRVKDIAPNEEYGPQRTFEPLLAVLRGAAGTRSEPTPAP